MEDNTKINTQLPVTIAVEKPEQTVKRYTQESSEVLQSLRAKHTVPEAPRQPHFGSEQAAAVKDDIKEGREITDEQDSLLGEPF